jgi:excisionase family DNA binding protein
MVSISYLLTTAEAAERLGVHRRKISRLVASGDLVPAKRLPDARGRGAHLFEPDDVEALAVQRECDRFVAR